METENNIGKAVAMRALRAFVSGAVSSIALITVANVRVWADFVPFLNMLGISALVGGINGVLMGADKWWRS